MKTGIAILGAGYVADMYAQTLSVWRDDITVFGVWDHDLRRLNAYTQKYDFPAYESLDELLNDNSVSIVVNLTNPHAHYATNMACLQAGKHVYVEKPFALDFGQAQELVELADAKDLELGCAPASVLGECAQTLWKAVRDEVAGKPRLVYAEIDDGLVHKAGYKRWLTSYGAHWPAEDEFKTGCTLEHAGYVLSWLVSMFGPVQKMVSESTLCIADKGAHTPKDYTTPDFATSTLTFESGMLARITMSVVAPHDHRLRIFCEKGIISVNEVWDFSEDVTVTPVLESRWAQALKRRFKRDGKFKLPPVRKSAFPTEKGAPTMGFAIGIAEMADALKTGRKPRLNKEFGLHITEVSLAIQHPEIFGHEYIVQSQFEKMEPMPWAA